MTERRNFKRLMRKTVRAEGMTFHAFEADTDLFLRRVFARAALAEAESALADAIEEACALDREAQKLWLELSEPEQQEVLELLRPRSKA